MNLSAAQLQRKRERKASKRRFYRARKSSFFALFGPWVGARLYEKWRASGGWWPMRRGRMRQIIKASVDDFRSRFQ